MVAGVTEGAPARAWGQTSATSTVDVRQAIKPINPPGMQTLPGCGSRLRSLRVDRNIAVVNPLLIHPFFAEPFLSGQRRRKRRCCRCCFKLRGLQQAAAAEDL